MIQFKILRYHTNKSLPFTATDAVSSKSIDLDDREIIRSLSIELDDSELKSLFLLYFKLFE